MTSLLGKPNLLVKSVEGFTLRIDWYGGNLIVSGIDDLGFELTGSELEAFVAELRDSTDDGHNCDQDCPCFEEALDDEDIDLRQFVPILLAVANPEVKEHLMPIEFPSPLRLSVGSHTAGSGKGCAMNVISWENGDKTITDFPECVDRFLARVVQRINDRICKHRQGSMQLCPECSVKVLDLAHRTVGTNLLATHSNSERAEIYAKIARTEVFYATAAAYVADAAATAAAYVADAYAYAVADAYAADAAAYAADAAADTAAYAVADAYAAADAAYAEFLITQGHRIIDQFEAFSGIKARPIDTAVVINAVQQMAAVK